MNSNYALMQALVFAFAGWIATCYCIVHSRIKPQTRRWLIIPLWFVWMIVAVGGPVFQGVVPVQDALSAVISLTIGLAFGVVMRRRSGSRSR
jgi:hypothetical protein